MATSVEDIFKQLEAKTASSKEDENILERVMQSPGRLKAGETIETKPEDTEGGPALVRGEMAFFGDTIKEKRVTFLRRFPQGTLDLDPVSNKIVFRTDPKNPLKELDPDFFDQVLAGKLPTAKEVGTDFLEFLGEDLPEIAGEALAVLPGGKAAGTLMRLGRAAVGAAGGEAVQQLTQIAADTQREDLKTQALRTLGAGAGGFIGQGAGEFIAGGINRIRGSGLLGGTPESEKVARAGADLDVGLLPQQISDVGFVVRLSKQAQALLPRINRFIVDQQTNLLRIAREGSTAEERQGVASAIKTDLDGVNHEILTKLTNPTSLRAGGRGLQQGVEAWENSSQIAVRGLYEASKKEGTPSFDLRPGLVTADEITERATTLGKLKDSADMTQIGAGVEPGLQRVIAKMKEIDPEQGLDQITALQRELHDMMLAGPEGARESQKNARRLFGSLDEILDNPVGGSTKAYKIARQAAKKRFDTREKLAIVNLLKSENPSSLVANLAMPSSGRNADELLDNLVLVRKTLTGKDSPPEGIAQFEKFKQAWLTEAHTRGLPEISDAMKGSKSLNVLFSKNERGALFEAAEETRKLRDSGVRELAAADVAARPFAQGIIQAGPKAVGVLEDRIKKGGGKSGPLAKKIQAALINDLTEGSVEVIRNSVRVINPNQYSKGIRALQESGAIRLLTPPQVALIKNLQRMSSATRASVDAGTSLAAAEASRGMVNFSADAFRTLVQNVSIGRFMTTKAGQKFFIGKGSGRKAYTGLKMSSLVLSEMADDAEDNLNRGQSITDVLKDTLGVARGALNLPPNGARQ